MHMELSVLEPSDLEASTNLIEIGRRASNNTRIKQGDTLLLDFFSGAGGATQGFLLSGMKPVYIVEAAQFKREQYVRNFGSVKVHQRDKSYFVYEDTAALDARLMIEYLKKITKNVRNIRYHVHASPSCREFCAVGRSANSKTKALGDSLGTFHWTCDVIKILKSEFQNKMTWSIEDAAEVAGKKGKRFDFPSLRSRLPAHTFNVWDFTLWGVPQDRKRFIALDASLNVSKLPEPLNTDNIEVEYLEKLIHQLDLDETKYDERKYGKSDMKGRIGMDTAFHLANVEFPEGVTHMLGQSSFGQVTSLIRVFNKALKKLKPQKEDKPKEYADVYCALTTLAYTDLCSTLQSMSKVESSWFYDDDEITAYIQHASDWLQGITENDVKEYCEAMYKAIGGKITFAFATDKNRQAHANISLTSLLKHLPKDNALYSKLEKVAQGKRKAKTSDLRDCFGLRVAREYSNDVQADGTGLEKKATYVRTRPIWAPAFTIQAQGDKNWYRPILKEGDTRWYTTAMQFSFLTVDQLKALGTFPLNFNFGASSRKEVRYAVGDSVPPLITLRLGLSIKNEVVKKEVALHALFHYTPTGGMMNTLLVDFEKYLSTYLGDQAVKRYLSIMEEHFNEHEFLGEQMIIPFKTWLIPKNRKVRGFNQAVTMYWTQFLQSRVGYFTNSILREYIIARGLWRTNWIKRNMWAHPDKEKRTTAKFKKEEAQYLEELRKKNYKPSEDTLQVLEDGLQVRLDILKNVFSIITSVKDDMKKEALRNLQEEQRKVIDAGGFSAYTYMLPDVETDSETDTDTDDEEPQLTNLYKLKF